MAHILVIDDEESMRMLLRMLLEADGHAVTTANEGGQALSNFDHSMHLVITDVLMPGMGGLQTIDSLRKRAPSVPIISMSGGGEVGSEEYLGVTHLIGADRSLAKPFSSVALRETIAELLPGATRPARCATATRYSEPAEVLKEEKLDAAKLRLPPARLLAAIRDAALLAQKSGHSGRHVRPDPEPEVTRAMLEAVIYCYLHKAYGSQEIEEACRSDEALEAISTRARMEEDALRKFRLRHRWLIQQALKELYWFLWVRHATTPSYLSKPEPRIPKRARVSPGLSERIDFESNECLYRAAFIDRMLSDN